MEGVLLGQTHPCHLWTVLEACGFAITPSNGSIGSERKFMQTKTCYVVMGSVCTDKAWPGQQSEKQYTK
jgi:hypothetical protein